VKLSENLLIYNVLYIPDFQFNLVSTQKIVKSYNCKLAFSFEFCEIQDVDSLKMIGYTRLSEGLYLMEIPKQEVKLNMTGTSIDERKLKNVWHLRLEHPSNKVLQHLTNNFPYIQFNDHKPCDACHYAKQHKLSFSHSNTRAKNIFDLIHVDIWGPFHIGSANGHRFFLTIVDDHSRFTWVFLMKTRFETREALYRFITLIHNQFNVTIKTIQSENESEFLCINLYNSLGIIHQTSCIETPQQNYVVERKHQHILNVTRSLLFQSKLPTVFLVLCYDSCHTLDKQDPFTNYK